MKNFVRKGDEENEERNATGRHLMREAVRQGHSQTI